MSHRDKTASLLLEGVCMTLFFACIITWLAIFETGGLR